MSAEAHRRVRKARARLAERAWRYRQRAHASGVWFRLRRLLAYSASVYAISAADADRLEREGHDAQPVGRELQPPKRIFVIEAADVDQLASKQELVVGLGADVLAAADLALVFFDGV